MKPIRLACRIVAAAALAMAVAAPALAAGHKTVLPEAARAIDGGRAVEVLVAQSEIKSDINQSRLTLYAGGGLLWAVIDAAVDAERAKKAEAAITPIRAALTGYDVDALALASAKAAFADIPWFEGPPPAFTRDSSPLNLSNLLDASPTRQLVLVEYVYDTSPDFASIRVEATVRFADKAIPPGKKPLSRLDPGRLAYAQTVTSVLTLLTPSKDAAENAARWGADDGKLARRALAAGFDEVAVLVPRALALKEEDLKKMGAHYHKLATTGGYTGRVQEQDATSALLYAANGGLVHARTIMP